MFKTCLKHVYNMFKTLISAAARPPPARPPARPHVTGTQNVLRPNSIDAQPKNMPQPKTQKEKKQQRNAQHRRQNTKQQNAQQVVLRSQPELLKKKLTKSCI